MPGEFLASTVVYAAAVWWLVRQDIQEGPLKYALYLIVSLPLTSPMAAFVIQYSAVIARRVGARVVVRRARAEMRSALAAARRHPELADLVRLREAAASLSRLAPADAMRAAEELTEVANHPYAPIREAGRIAMDALAGIRREARSGPPGI
jgi:hypothetical protein